MIAKTVGSNKEAALGSARPQEEGRGQEASPAERLIAAQARRNQAEANKDVNAMIDAGDEASTALIEGIQAEMDAGRMPVIQDGSLYHAIHPSTSRLGKLQITTYNDTGALSDTTVDGMDGVQRELNASKARIMPADEANETMNRIGRAEAEYQQRRKAFELGEDFYSIAIEMFENDDSAWQLIGKTPLDMRVGGSTVAQAASEYLKSLGINGIKYLDGNSRDGSGDGYNYVVFDDSLIEIEEVFYSKAGLESAYGEYHHDC